MIWELIHANKRKSMVLFIGMGTVLMGLGYIIGTVYAPPNGGYVGLFIAIIVWVVMATISYFGGDSILLSVSQAKEVTHDVHPQLFNIVEEMKIASGLSIMPKVYIIPEQAPNAFATGIRPEKCAVAVTAGLLSRLNRDELQGVIAHEMGHIANRDVLFMTFAGIMMGSIVLVSEIFLRSMWFSSGSSKRYKSSNSSQGGGQAQLIIMIVAIVLAILSPLIARLLYFAMSRKREYLADASAVRFTRYPEGLASALEKISNNDLELASANKATAPMYIINPLKAKGKKVANLTSTHPPITERIAILRGMHHGAGFVNYQEAYESATKKNIITASMLKEDEKVSIRKASEETKSQKSNKQKMRDVGDLMRAVNNYMFISCVCGLKIKIPPEYKKKTLACPRCGKKHDIPFGDLKTAATILATNEALSGTQVKQDPARVKQTYKRQGKGWETLKCNCGKQAQLSPAFQGQSITCAGCNGTIEIT